MSPDPSGNQPLSLFYFKHLYFDIELNSLRSNLRGIELTKNSKEILHHIFTCYAHVDNDMQNFPS